MFCIKCGKELPDTAKFCPACGTSTDDEIPVENTGDAPKWGGDNAGQAAVRSRISIPPQMVKAAAVIIAGIVLLAAVVGIISGSSKNKQYAKRMDAYIKYYESVKNEPGYEVGGSISLDKNGMPVMWLIYIETGSDGEISAYSNSITQLLSYERGKVKVLDEVKIREGYPDSNIVSAQGICLSGYEQKGVYFLAYDEKNKKLEKWNYPERDEEKNTGNAEFYIDHLVKYYEAFGGDPTYYFKYDGTKLVYVGKRLNEEFNRCLPDSVLDEIYEVGDKYKKNKELKKFLDTYLELIEHGYYRSETYLVFDKNGKYITREELKKRGYDYSTALNRITLEEASFGELKIGEQYISADKEGFVVSVDFIGFMERLKKNPARTPEEYHLAWMEQFKEFY